MWVRSQQGNKLINARGFYATGNGIFVYGDVEDNDVKVAEYFTSEK